ncbi:MAG: DUF2752 domain-containing protein, partial [Verrucomicrobiota bacterium]
MKWGLIGLPLATGLGFLFLFNPAKVSWIPQCPWFFLSGFYCPGCGSVRATHHLLHGNLIGAFRLNPL